jgi:hypothetical protein
LAPKKVSQYISSIEQGMGKLVESLLNETLASGKLDPFDLLQLTSINIISNVSVGFQYESVNDPDFIKYMDMAVEATKLASVEMDLPLYLPVLKPVTRFIGIEKRMDHFINEICGPFMQKLVKQATIKEGPNIIKEFNKEGYMFTDRQKSVIISNFYIVIIYTY